MFSWRQKLKFKNYLRHRSTCLRHLKYAPNQRYIYTKQRETFK